ncbi:MAG: adenylate/guanylate cyclase domain-containing protein, partial [Bacteroidota bacterium]
ASFALIYHGLFYPHTLGAFIQSGIIGLLLGFTSGIFEEYLLKDFFRRRPFTNALLLRTILYAVIATIALMTVLTIIPFMLGKCPHKTCFLAYFGDYTFLQDLAFSLLIIFLTTLNVQIFLLIGVQNMRRLLTGQFHQPREISATFLFADIRNSTTLAEQLGNWQFSNLLSDFFNDVSDAICQAKGEIYQYVGDEVIIVWPDNAPRHSFKWLDCFMGMQKSIAQRAHYYQKKYGVIPEFKAGVHRGLVIASEIGVQQKAYVYHGDILNTAARLQAKCNEVGFDLLASKKVIATLSLQQRSDFESIGTLALKGKQEKVVAYGFCRRRDLGKKNNSFKRNAHLRAV